jgi:hypothetical protein
LNRLQGIVDTPLHHIDTSRGRELVNNFARGVRHTHAGIQCYSLYLRLNLALHLLFNLLRELLT